VIESDEDEGSVLPLPAMVAGRERLPYRIELLAVESDEVERVLARASSAGLARAIFQAAQSEYLGRRLVLRRSGAVIAEIPPR
jgi:hypothetical protein